VWDIEGVDSNGWKVIFSHHISADNLWVKGVWDSQELNPDNTTDMTRFSLLRDLEKFRRSSDGALELKACWPDSGFAQCMIWTQKLNPTMNPDSSNSLAHCLSCPYHDNDEDFKGLMYDGINRLLDGNPSGGDLEIGAHALRGGVGMNGPRAKNDDGVTEYPKIVELSVRPDTSGPACIDCLACYDSNGHAQTADWNGTKGLACPDYCLEYIESQQEWVGPSTTQTGAYNQNQTRAVRPRSFKRLMAPHQLVVMSQGLKEKACVTVDTVKRHGPDEGIKRNETICEGQAHEISSNMPEEPAFRVGGSKFDAFFVAPITANYTFNVRFDDGGELWLSENADPRQARRVVSTDYTVTKSTTDPEPHTSQSSAQYLADFGETATATATAAPSELCASWTNCAEGKCYRLFNGLLNYAAAENACSAYGGRLAIPRTAAQESAILQERKHNVWIGMDDRAREGEYRFSDGTIAGSCGSGAASCEGFENSVFAGQQPDDANGNENCVEIDGHNAFNDLICTASRRFICEIDGCHRARSTPPIPMKQGEVRYLEMLAINDADQAGSLLSLTIDQGGQQWTTSEVRGLSAEFFRLVRTDAPAIEVVVNKLTASTSLATFEYLESLTPTVTSVEPTSGLPGTTIIFTGTGFSRHKQLNRVVIGTADCDVMASNDTFIECKLPPASATAGRFLPKVTVFNEGRALIPVPGLCEYEVLMQIDDMQPRNGSVYGGMTLTLTGLGFATFGLHNQVTLTLVDTGSGLPSAQVEGTHDIYEDHVLWGRGDLAPTESEPYGPYNLTNVSEPLRTHEVLCVPRTVKNKECRYSEDDSGFECSQPIAYAYDDIRVRGDAEWFDFSSSTSIECVVESFRHGLPDMALAHVEVTVVNTSVLLDTEALVRDMESARLNFNCIELGHCIKKNIYGEDTSYFGAAWDRTGFTGATGASPHSFTFMDSATPVVYSLSPPFGMPGQLLSLRGKGLAPRGPQLETISNSAFSKILGTKDTNWYMDEFGFFAQPTAAVVTIGTYKCQIFFHNDTLVQCHVVYGDMYTPHDLKVAIDGYGNARADENFTFALNIYDITPKTGSLAGGTEITVHTSPLHSDSSLGKAIFGVWFIERNPNAGKILNEGISKFIADYFKLDIGIVCEGDQTVTLFEQEVKKALESTKHSISCTTTASDPDVWDSPKSVHDKRLVSWVIGEWNRDEIYSECFEQDINNCDFTYSAAFTPVLDLDWGQSQLLLSDYEVPGITEWSEETQAIVTTGTYTVTHGDRLVMSHSVSPLAGQTNCTNAESDPFMCFNWTVVTVDDITMTLNDGAMTNISLEVVEGSSVTLSATVGPDVPPAIDSQLDLTISPYGHGVVIVPGKPGENTFNVVPVVTAMSHDKGSTAGGLEVEFEGEALMQRLPYTLTVGNRTCEPLPTAANTTSTTRITCTTSRLLSRVTRTRGTSNPWTTKSMGSRRCAWRRPFTRPRCHRSPTGRRTPPLSTDRTSTPSPRPPT
jgi:hypothetical protein